MEKFQGPTNQCFGGNLGVDEECHGYTGFNLSYGAPCFNLQGERFTIQEQQSSLPITSLEDNMPFLEMLKSVDSPYYSDPAPVNPHFRMLLKLQQQQIQIPGHFSGSSSSDQSSMDYYYSHQMETPQPVAFEPQSCDSATTAKAENLANSSVKPEDNKEKEEQEHMVLLEQDQAQDYYLSLHLESSNNENNNMDNGELGREPPNYASPECRQTVSSPTTTRCLAGTECISPRDTPSKTKSASKPAPPASRLVTGSTTTTTTTSGGGGHEREKKKRKRTRPNKNREEVESQRMTHIAVERNRRRQMNDHLNALRSLMPPSFAQRGDQASIIGGAIDFVKELEQLLQSLEAKKRMRASSEDEDDKVEIKGHKGRRRRHRNCGDHSESAPFLGFFSSPQYTSYSTSLFLKNDAEEEDEKEEEEVINEDELRMMSSNNIKRGSSINSSSSNEHEYYSLSLLSPSSCLGVDIEVAVIQTHVNLKILGPRRAGQLARAISALEQDLRLTILHLTVTSFRLSVLYSFNLKIEDDCKLGSSADEIATAVYQIFSSANTRSHLVS